MKHYIKTGKLKAEEELVWTKILKSWINIHEIYYSQTKGDKAYYYNERASISLLAASIWKKEGVAIEEYKAKKIREDKKENGRVDLWFHLDEYSAIVEAKHLRRNVKEFSKNSETKNSETKKLSSF